MPPLITLIADSGVQFWDVDLDLERLPRVVRLFWDQRLPGQLDAAGKERAALRELHDRDQSGVLVDPVSGVMPPEEEIYRVDRARAMELHLGRWMPLPFFRRRSQQSASFARGPSNWARGRLAEHPEPGRGRTHRLTIAFDTALVPRDEGPTRYVAPAPQDIQQEFGFVADPTANAWFVEETWIGDWLYQALIDLLRAQRGGRPLRENEVPEGCQHFARYLVWLGLLEASEQMPRVRLLDPAGKPSDAPSVWVDLVLDVGNTRTCGILIEEHPGQGIHLSDSYPLMLRELSRAERQHERPFESRVEFARASFGSELLSRDGGRTNSFAWPSLVRVGPEAVRLAGARNGTEGATGLSSPKRYLWDTRPANVDWRFNGRASTPPGPDTPVNGPANQWMDEKGDVHREFGKGAMAGRPRFSRSALFTFMLVEILFQAVNQMNAPANRARWKNADLPRRLRTVLLTTPPGMPVAEQAHLRRRAQDAVRLAWKLMGLTDRLQLPQIKVNLDEATATQIVWLHNEVTERLQGDSGALMELYGRARPEVDAARPSLRLASIDVGGGTTDLMVTTYTASGEAIVPRQEFRESFKIAGDDVLERVLTLVVAPALEAALSAAGVVEPHALTSRTLGQDLAGLSEADRHLRRQFVAQVLEPAGLAIIHAYEQVSGRTTGEVLRKSIGAIVGQARPEALRAIEFFEAEAGKAGARDFRVADTVIVAESNRIEALTRAVLGPVLADLCEAVWSLDCDVLLLSGRPSRMRVVADIVDAKAPVPVHNIIRMHRYRVGNAYPFRDAQNRIDDPKTTAAVGAALSVQAEGRLHNFLLRTRDLRLRSTARFIGKMANDGQIRDENVLLENLDLDGPAREDTRFTIPFQAITQLGFRQLPLARWTATPLYVMEFAVPDNAPMLPLPLRVTVERRQLPAGGGPGGNDAELHEMFQISEILDAQGDPVKPNVVTLRLQTMGSQEGYWRDTGRLAIG
jgi:hypothetical protein